ncbi:hypothetical protein [Rugamonas rivuli]|uniref:Uncharacterized protein n=1 Tax=Rugamonas rivuli TaxID=2743358 RepID=A0A843SDS3_9BURK|nr:hypothetical protein [Rugamonas rivuli]MQA18827.1 hypothetical protein [Rugamonas rivuli]
METLSGFEIEQVGGAVNRSDILNYGAAITAVGAAALGGLALVSASPAIGVAAAVYGVASGAMWLGSSMYGMGVISGSGGHSLRFLPWD